MPAITGMSDLDPQTQRRWQVLPLGRVPWGAAWWTVGSGCTGHWAATTHGRPSIPRGGASRGAELSQFPQGPLVNTLQVTGPEFKRSRGCGSNHLVRKFLEGILKTNRNHGNQTLRRKEEAVSTRR